MSADRSARLAVVDGSDDGSCAVAADALAAATGMPRAELSDAGFDGWLLVRPDRVTVCWVDSGARREVFADFILGSVAGRRRFVGTLRGPFAKAIGVRGRRPWVVDATAGLCGDAFRAVMLGCRVTAIERSAAVFALVQDGVRRARRVPELCEVFDERFELVNGDARTVLAERFGDSRPEVVYLDPMFESREGSSAAVRLEMRSLRMLVGDDVDADELLGIAMRTARDRVVVKRMRHAPPLGERPSVSIKGRVARYDVYLIGGAGG